MPFLLCKQRTEFYCFVVFPYFKNVHWRSWTLHIYVNYVHGLFYFKAYYTATVWLISIISAHVVIYLHKAPGRQRWGAVVDIDYCLTNCGCGEETWNDKKLDELYTSEEQTKGKHYLREVEDNKTHNNQTNRCNSLGWLCGLCISS